MNLSLLKSILTTEHEYWILLRRVEYTDKHQDYVMFVSIPRGIDRLVPVNEILLSQIEKLNGCYVDQNIHLNYDYPPFQTGINMRECISGFPITVDKKQFLTACLIADKTDYYGYERIHEEMSDDDKPF